MAYGVSAVAADKSPFGVRYLPIGVVGVAELANTLDNLENAFHVSFGKLTP